MGIHEMHGIHDIHEYMKSKKSMDHMPSMGCMKCMKSMPSMTSMKTMTDMTQFMPGALAGLAARLYTGFGLATRIRPFLNTVITNVPGPQVPLYFTGARMMALHGLGPVLDGMGIIHPVFSYDGRISIAVTACRDQLPDPAFYAECLQGAFDALKAAVPDAPLPSSP